MIETMGVIGGGESFKEFEITNDGTLYYLVEKGSQSNVNDKYYDNATTAYLESCKFLRELKIRFILSIPNWNF